MSTDWRRLLVLDGVHQRHYLRTLRLSDLDLGPGEDALLLWGEALCHYLLREDPATVVIARGPLVFLSGNKATVGYISPLTKVPHYSFVGGRGFSELLNLGLDAIVLGGFDSVDEAYAAELASDYVVVSGRAPDLQVTWRPAADLPEGQRGAFYWLLDRELEGDAAAGSLFTVGHGARHGYPIANVAVEGLYHAGRGGAGYVFSRYLRALVLTGAPETVFSRMGEDLDAFRTLQQGPLYERLEASCMRLSRCDGGTVSKLHVTGSGGTPTLPARNAQTVGYALADLGARQVLRAHRVGQTGCQWCQVDCRHWHWVDVDYAPGGQDRYLDDFEPTYALFAMLDLAPDDDALQARLDLIERVDREVMVPIEQMGIDVIDAGVGTAALFEGLDRGLIPTKDVPPSLRQGPYFGSLERAAAVVAALHEGSDAPAIRALAEGPQGLARRYPELQDIIFTSGAGTLGNPGHANALWTFLMPFSRFFGHYSGQIYKVPGTLTPDMTPDEVADLFASVVETMLKREFFICLGNALSTCAFTFVIFSEDGAGEVLDPEDLLPRLLSVYGIKAQAEDLMWFAEAFWVQSMLLKARHGWQPPAASDLPGVIYDLLSQVLGRPSDDLQHLMAQLIGEWKRQSAAVISKFGYTAPWSATTGAVDP